MSRAGVRRWDAQPTSVVYALTLISVTVVLGVVINGKGWPSGTLAQLLLGLCIGWIGVVCAIAAEKVTR